MYPTLELREALLALLFAAIVSVDGQVDGAALGRVLAALTGH